MSQMQAQVLDILEQNVKFAIDVIQKEKRQYINKHVQNSLNNYFLENYCVLDLKKRFEIHSGRQIKNTIQDKYSSSTLFSNLNLNFAQEQQVALKKYYVLMLGFLEEHIINGSLDKYREAMLKIVLEDAPQSPFYETSSDGTLKWVSPYTIYNNDKDKISKWVQLQWKRLLALFVLHHSYYPKIEAIYQIWFDIFQTRIVDATTQKKKKPENNRPYKYFELPYLSNNDYYSSQPLVVAIAEENNAKVPSRKPKQQQIQTSNSIASENGSLREKTEGTAAESAKQNQNNNKRKYKSTKLPEVQNSNDNSSLGEISKSKNTKKFEKSSNIQEQVGPIQQSNSDNQVIEKMPYKKAKRQSDLYCNSSSAINESNNNSNIIVSNKNEDVHAGSDNSKKQLEDYRNIQISSKQNLEDTYEKSQSCQMILKSSRKESMNSLSKDYFPQQSQSGFQKYNKKIQSNGSNQSKINSDQVINFNNSLDSILKSKQDQNNNSSSSPKAIISIIPINNNSSSANSNSSQENSKKQLEKSDDQESSNNQQEKQNGCDQSTCNPSQNVLQSPVSQAPQIPINGTPINGFQFQLNSMVNTQPAIHFQQQPLQLMFQQYIPHQQINQFIHPNQIAPSQQMFPYINVNNIPFVHVPFNYIGMIPPSCAPAQTTFMNINQF